MPLLPPEALPYFENMIYLPMLLIILERDRESIEKGPFKLKGPYVKLIDKAMKRCTCRTQGNEALFASS